MSHSKKNTDWTDAYIALGSNIGDRKRVLHDALLLLDRHPAIQVVRVSSIYETDPIGYTDQSAFLNMTAALSTTLAPLALLHVLLDFEKRLGRIRDIHWGPRTIDLDLLLMTDIRMDEEELTLPHPRMMGRAFVLVPLREVLPSGHPLQEQINQVAVRVMKDGGEGIALWNTINWPDASAHSAN